MLLINKIVLDVNMEGNLFLLLDFSKKIRCAGLGAGSGYFRGRVGRGLSIKYFIVVGYICLLLFEVKPRLRWGMNFIW